MTKIGFLKIAKGEITVEYSSAFESVRIQAADKARAELYRLAAEVAFAAREVLSCDLEGAGFLLIAISHGDNPSTRLVLSMSTAVGDAAKIACPKIDRTPIVRPESGEPIEGHPRNVYNEIVARLEAEIEEFIKGKRQQMSLPFDEPIADKSESGKTASRVLKFAEAASGESF